jgi:hypothetical protein
MTESLELSPPESALQRWLDRGNPFRRGNTLHWPAAWLISLVLVFAPLATWWFASHFYLWDRRFAMQLAWIYFGSPLLTAAIWKSGKVFTTALVMVWVTLLLDVAWQVL